MTSDNAVVARVERLSRLVAAYHTEEIRAFVRDAFGGAVVPAF